ncbi:ABC transporter substrate-binding protein [Actinomadura livida]|uniref:Branched-chain amino acid transport system substrate-binding protein n=1 Tax=Actinomadura livida TaxID=79909 RepID=A0A7W7IIH3_9ACTN|nr:MULTISPECIES: ABC transporter substrate-binding protein [Actinomadura]MBB4777318.1 branched-chain amino acid transport system substrate-binding protein [Actinomadura catellatispora]GGU20099.1 hypothetical protein GCM10010208_51280 [Actinomadura livida]
MNLGMHKGTTLRRVLLSGGVGLLLTAAAACGGSDEPSDDPTLTGAPIKVGLFNPDKGAVAVPAVKSGMDAGVSYVAKELKGVQGRPIVVEACSVDGTPESTIGCANKFVQEGVVAAFDGFNLSSSAGIAILEAAKIPLIGQIPFDQTTGSAASGRVYLGPPQASFLIGALQGFKAEGKKSATLTLVDTPASHKTIDTQLKPLAGALGIKANGLYYSPTNPNFSALAATIASTKPDVAGLIAAPNASTCIQLIKNLRSVGYKGDIFVAACMGFIKSDPANAPGATLYSSVWLPGTEKHAPKEAVDNLKAATEYISKTSGPADFYAYAQFATVVDFAKALSAGSSSGELTGESVLSTLKGLKDFPTFLGTKITCGKEKSPNCTTQMLLFSVQKDLSLKPVTGDWITPAPEIMATIPGAS